jgi:hypothetical protein
MPRRDEPRELNHDDIIAVANECLEEGTDAYEIALALWILRSAFTDHFGPRYRSVHRQAFLTWKRSIVERNVTRPRERPAS